VGCRRVKLVFVAESHRLERKDRFARFIHRLDRVFESFGRDYRPHVAAGIDNHSHASGNSCTTDPRNKSIRLVSYSADANCIRFGCNT
jgi:hypothetical protein